MVKNWIPVTEELNLQIESGMKEKDYIEMKCDQEIMEIPEANTTLVIQLSEVSKDLFNSFKNVELKFNEKCLTISAKKFYELLEGMVNDA